MTKLQSCRKYRETSERKSAKLPKNLDKYAKWQESQMMTSMIEKNVDKFPNLNGK